MANPTYAVTVAFARSLAARGLRHVVITPGSRNTPLTLAFAAVDGITDWSFHDERSAAFFALGIAKTSGVPAALVCTSGTAAAEYLPAVVEAGHARVPLLVLTADRPPELRGVGAPQAIDQVKLYGDAVRWFHEVGVPDDGGILAGTVPALAARAWSTALGPPPGPVHLNFAFREPLAPEPVQGGVPIDTPPPATPRWHPARPVPDPGGIDEVARLVSGKRALIVAGEQPDSAFPGALAGFAAAAGFPILADPLSGLRRGDHDLTPVIGSGYLLAAAGFGDRAEPEVIVRCGALPTAQPLWRWLERRGDIPQILVDDAGWRDPLGTASLVVHGDPAATVAALSGRVDPAPEGWMERWRAADAVASAAVAAGIAAGGFPSEPGTVRALAGAMPPGSLLFVASSMPVRDLDMFLPPSDRPLRILANRGANGIDGFLSSGLGAAAAHDGPAYLLAGDLSVLHDLTALVTAARLRIPATIVAVNNDGGGIFHFLPQVHLPEHFERHFGTPHGLRFAELAPALGVPATEPATPEELAAALAPATDGPRLVEVRTNREENAALHRDLRAVVAEAIRAG